MKILLQLFLLITSFIVSQAQFSKKAVDKALNAKLTGDDKQSFSGILNALGQFTSQDEATIRFQPTLFGLASLFNPKIREQDKFTKAAFLRNFQLNLGVTPSEESIFDVDDFQGGFTYAILNNKKLTEADYKALAEGPVFTNRANLNIALGKYAFQKMLAKDSAKEKLARQLFKEGITENNIRSMPADMLDSLMKDLGITDPQQLVNFSEGPHVLFKKMTTNLAKKTLLTVDFSSTYSFEKNEWNEFTFTPFNLIKYFNKESLKSPGLNLKLKYTIGEDTAAKEKLKRNLYVAEAGINFPLFVNDKEKIDFEIKPGVKYTYISNRLYVDEKRSQFNPTVTLRLRINDDFYLPLVFEYNTEDAELLGFLSVQFSLN
jgi:hypothetical protein